MKHFIIILSGLFLCVVTSHVSYATDVGKHLSTKTEYSVPVMYYDFVALESNTVMIFVAPAVTFKPVNVEPLCSMADLVSDVGKEYDHGIYLAYKASNYRSPSVDKDYKWKYSAWYNS